MKIKIFYKILLLFVIILIYSCDIFYFVGIANNSSNTYSVVLEFDKESLKNLDNKSRDYITHHSNSWNRILIKYDSINLVSKYKLFPKDTFKIDSDRAGYKKFKYIKSIKIFSHDTIVLNGKEEIETAFKNVGNQLFILNIK